MTAVQPISLYQLNQRVANTLNSSPVLQTVWVTAETSDVRVSGGHCYLELVDKDPANGQNRAKMRAVIWANTYTRLLYKFRAETGQNFQSNIKVMVLVSITFHPLYGISLVINDINSAYTMGDLLVRRAEMIQRLTKEGIIGENKRLKWPAVPQRIAIISAAGAAGYGDFINQLYNNSARLRFTTKLFPAVLQGERTAPTVIAALEKISAEIDRWDGVVIIRGGGATTDLLAFENYDLAANIALFPIPVIIGIGHERDITLLDYVANMRVKTPTAAAEWLVGCGERALGYLQSVANYMLQTVQQRMSGCHRQLAYISGQLPAATQTAIIHTRQKLVNARIVLSGVNDRRLRPELMRLGAIQTSLAQAVDVAISRTNQKLDSYAQLADALSPQATLRRGYSITRIAGHAVKQASDITPGDVIETVLAEGILYSKAIAHGE